MSDLQLAEVELSVALTRRSFETKRRGYDPEEVDEYLETVTASVRRLLDELARSAAERQRTEADSSRARTMLQETQRALRAAEQNVDNLRDALREAEHAREAAEVDARRLQAQVDELRAAVTTLEAERALLAAAPPSPAAAGDAFDRLGDEVAGVLRSAHEAADAMRERTAQELEQLRAETDALCDSLLADADTALRCARDEAAEIVERARAEAEAMMRDATERTEHLERTQQELRQGLEAAANWVMRAVQEPFVSLPGPSLQPEMQAAAPPSAEGGGGGEGEGRAGGEAGGTPA